MNKHSMVNTVIQIGSKEEVFESKQTDTAIQYSSNLRSDG